MTLLSRSEEIILLAIYKLRGNAYGVTIREQVKNDIGRYWPFGVIYKTLKKLNVKGYVDKTASAPVSKRGGRIRYYYEITSEGIAALEKILDIHMSLWREIQALGFGKKAK